jgi:2-oxoacid:acceptor oxidoreductase, gamma subunit, pyruvate/2-ketoisovalerate family
MVEIRIHGRGGQGVVTAADLLAMAAFTEGHYAQAFPSFGSERTGAPVVSYCRISDAPIRSREPVLDPDIVIVQDPTLLPVMDVFSGLKPGGIALINSSKEPEELGHWPGINVMTVPAGEIAKKHVGRPLPNAALLGALAAITGQFDIKNVAEAIKQRWGGNVGKRNADAAIEAFETVKAMRKESVNA